MAIQRLLCCDWGTSNFRLYLVDIDSQVITAEVAAHNGVAETNNGFSQQATLNKVDYFRVFLNSQIQRLSKECAIQLAEIPVILSGMASSSIGMVDVPYMKLPFSLNEPALNFEKIPSDALCSHELFVFGGLQSPNDVMRGEEVQLLGLRQTINTNSCVCILPGTHSKHISIENNTVVGFKTYMTGELFQLLSQQSILKNSVEATDTMTNEDQIYFEKGVISGANSNLLHSLFGVRTNKVLHDLASTHNYYYLSGLLIGYELSSLIKEQVEIYLSGASRLAVYYQLALKALNLDESLRIVSQDQMKMAIPNAHIFLFNCYS